MRITIVALALMAAMPAQAQVFTYKCKAGGKALFAKIDSDANTFKWRGKTYKIVEQPECAKYGWKVTGYGRSFDACTATKGYLDFPDDNGSTAVCGLQ